LPSPAALERGCVCNRRDRRPSDTRGGKGSRRRQRDRERSGGYHFQFCHFREIGKMVRAFENELLFEAQNFGKETYNN
jgi:hypothetical protein